MSEAVKRESIGGLGDGSCGSQEISHEDVFSDLDPVIVQGEQGAVNGSDDKLSRHVSANSCSALNSLVENAQFTEVGTQAGTKKRVAHNYESKERSDTSSPIRQISFERGGSQKRINEVIETQWPMLATRNLSRRKPVLKRFFTGSSLFEKDADNLDGNASGSKQTVGTVRCCWNEYMTSLTHHQPEFFSSPVAKLEITGRTRKVVSTYNGLRVTERNNMNGGQVHDLEYEAKVCVGSSEAAYSQFCSAVGQFLCRSVLFDCVDPNLLCNKRKSFSGTLSMNTIRAFLHYFDIRTSPSTVLTKSLHLIKFLYYGKLCFQRKAELENV